MPAATIVYPYDARIVTLFAAEEKDIGRARYSISHDDQQLTFAIDARDATSLRAALTTITKILSMWEASDADGRSRES